MGIDLEQLGRCGIEHDAWLAVVMELREVGVGEIEPGEEHERLHDTITRWGEELAQLRIHGDPIHTQAALEQRRENWGRWQA